MGRGYEVYCCRTVAVFARIQSPSGKVQCNDRAMRTYAWYDYCMTCAMLSLSGLASIFAGSAGTDSPVAQTVRLPVDYSAEMMKENHSFPILISPETCKASRCLCVCFLLVQCAHACYG